MLEYKMYYSARDFNTLTNELATSMQNAYETLQESQENYSKQYGSIDGR
ncbi:MAG: hypothetical protein PV340_01755 [Wolbachia sp.]|nr:hypothetical protein [Wolbachia sp.]MDD9336451.1 hypothetical protein [Wolbachia sp.]